MTKLWCDTIEENKEARGEEMVTMVTVFSSDNNCLMDLYPFYGAMHGYSFITSVLAKKGIREKR